MRRLGAKISLPDDQIYWSEIDAYSDIYQVADSPHIAISILEFPTSGWRNPRKSDFCDICFANDRDPEAVYAQHVDESEYRISTTRLESGNATRPETPYSSGHVFPDKPRVEASSRECWCPELMRTPDDLQEEELNRTYARADPVNLEPLGDQAILDSTSSAAFGEHSGGAQPQDD